MVKRKFESTTEDMAYETGRINFRNFHDYPERSSEASAKKLCDVNYVGDDPYHKKQRLACHDGVNDELESHYEAKIREQMK